MLGIMESWNMVITLVLLVAGASTFRIGSSLKRDSYHTDLEQPSHPATYNRNCHNLCIHSAHTERQLWTCLLTNCSPESTESSEEDEEDSSDMYDYSPEEEIKRHETKRANLREKKWQYTDPLTVCISGKCAGLQNALFYQCVYSKCVAAGKEDRRK